MKNLHFYQLHKIEQLGHGVGIGIDSAKIELIEYPILLYYRIKNRNYSASPNYEFINYVTSDK
jgi:hypothetical protein